MRRPGSCRVSAGVCQCPEDYYTEKGQCRKRKLVGESCKGGQCAQNSLCSSFFGGVCQCVDGFFEDSGHCVGGELTMCIPFVVNELTARALSLSLSQGCHFVIIRQKQKYIFY